MLDDRKLSADDDYEKRVQNLLTRLFEFKYWIILGFLLVKKICLCREPDTRDCFFDTRKSLFLVDFVCRSRILVCRPSAQTKNFMIVSHLCPAKGTKQNGILVFSDKLLIFSRLCRR